MDNEKFIAAIRSYVRDAAIEDVLGGIEQPKGRRVSDDARRMSAWFHELSDVNRKDIQRIVELAVDTALFGFLVVLDGDRVVVEDSSEEARFELSHIDQERTVLNPPGAIGLHDLYNAFTK